MAKILELRYLKRDKTVELRVEGHFTEAAELSRKIADILLRPNGRWRFTKIQGIMAPEYDYASELILEIIARNIG